ncbi:MAG: sensor domain-containing protein [Chloroflexota bacterium]
MYNTIENYLEALKQEMSGSDAALVQDAQADAREHLSLAMEDAKEKNPEINTVEVLQTIIEGHGSPEETAAAYREIERRTTPSLKTAKKQTSLIGRFFGIYLDPRTWGSLLFMFIAFVTGIIYFTWVVTGLSLSVGLFILIIGIPFTILFLLTVQGLALLEGRLVEALLGERMPRRPLFAQPGLKWLDRLKALVTDKHTWLSMIYMILQLPLGVIYFTINTTLISVSLAFMAAPFIQFFSKTPIIHLDSGPVILPYWQLFLFALSGFILLTMNMHLTRGIGWLHGKYAKKMLVSLTD